MQVNWALLANPPAGRVNQASPIHTLKFLIHDDDDSTVNSRYKHTVGTGGDMLMANICL